MQHFRMTSDPCCLLPAGKRATDTYELYERQVSGETVIPGTNATVQDVVDTFDRITDKLDMIQVPVEYEQSQLDALIKCTNSGLCS